MVPNAASAAPTARAASASVSATTTESCGNAPASREAQPRVVGVCGGSIRNVVIVPRSLGAAPGGVKRSNYASGLGLGGRRGGRTGKDVAVSAAHDGARQ